MVLDTLHISVSVAALQKIIHGKVRGSAYCIAEVLCAETVTIFLLVHFTEYLHKQGQHTV